MRLPVLTMALTAALFATPALAQSAATPACATKDQALPAGFTTWTQRTDITAAVAAPPAALGIGKAVNATLADTAKIKFALAPEKAPGAGTFGGLFAIDVAQAGTYRFAFSGHSWVDLVRDGKTVASTGHGGAPACSTITKLVEFPLTPGRYVLQISGAEAAQIAVLVAKK